jgi:hypothetical protein
MDALCLVACAAIAALNYRTSHVDPKQEQLPLQLPQTQAVTTRSACCRVSHHDAYLLISHATGSSTAADITESSTGRVET